MHTDLQEAIDLHDSIVAEAGKAFVGYDTEKTLANVVLLSEIPTTYDKDQKRQVNAGNLLLRGVPGVGKTFFGVILAAISDAKFVRLQGRADLQPTEVVGSDGPVRDHGQHPVPAAEGRTKAGELRFQADEAQPADLERTDHRAARRHHARSVSARDAGQVHSPTRGRNATIQCGEWLALSFTVGSRRKMRGSGRVAARDDLLGMPGEGVDPALAA